MTAPCEHRDVTYDRMECPGCRQQSAHCRECGVAMCACNPLVADITPNLDTLPSIDVSHTDRVYLEPPPGWVAPFVAWATGAEDLLDLSGHDVPVRVQLLLRDGMRYYATPEATPAAVNAGRC